MRTLLKIFFHHFYHSFAWTYDFVAAFVSVGRWDAWRRAALPHIRGPRVLEIGFGTGHLQVELKKNGFQTVGVDESRQMAVIAKRNLSNNGLDAGLARGYAQSLPFTTRSQDSVIATFPSEYIMEKSSLAEIKRVMKPTGRLVVVPMAWIGGRTLPDRVTKWLFRVTGQTAEFPESLEKRVTSLFNQEGFEVEIVREQVRGSIVLVIIAGNPGDPTHSI